MKTTSENITRTFRKYGVDVVHKPSPTIKNRICHLKDKIHQMEKSGPLYKITCKKHPGEKYIGETERGMKYRAYEHKIIEHKQVTKSWSTDIENVEEESEDNVERKSNRLKEKKRVDYARMAKGKIEKDEEEKTYSSEVAEHLIINKHDKKDMEIEFLGFETKWWERGVKESIYIRKEKPTLNADNGRYNLSRIWDNVIINDEIN